DEVEMCVRLEGIIDICKATENSHFIWFARLLNNHLRGIYTFAKYGISTGKLEGINNKIKTERRKGYGYPDDEYFFLRLMEISRKAS
ncbi:MULTISPECIES: transposase, partial [Enterococcus]